MASTSNGMTFFCPPMSDAQRSAFWRGEVPPATDGLGITIRVDPATWRQQVQDALRGTIGPDDDGGAAALAARAEQLMQTHQQLSSTDDPDGLATAA